MAIGDRPIASISITGFSISQQLQILADRIVYVFTEIRSIFVSGEDRIVEVIDD